MNEFNYIITKDVPKNESEKILGKIFGIEYVKTHNVM